MAILKATNSNVIMSKWAITFNYMILFSDKKKASTFKKLSFLEAKAADFTAEVRGNWNWQL